MWIKICCLMKNQISKTLHNPSEVTYFVYEISLKIYLNSSQRRIVLHTIFIFFWKLNLTVSNLSMGFNAALMNTLYTSPINNKVRLPNRKVNVRIYRDNGYHIFHESPFVGTLNYSCNISFKRLAAIPFKATVVVINMI